MTAAAKQASVGRRKKPGTKATMPAKATSRTPAESTRPGKLTPRLTKVLDTKVVRRRRATAPEDFKTSTLQIRVKDEVKQQATATLEKIGISLPEAVRVFLSRIVREQGFPFPLEVPNAETTAALRESMAASDRNRFTALTQMFDELEQGGAH